MHLFMMQSGQGTDVLYPLSGRAPDQIDVYSAQQRLRNEIIAETFNFPTKFRLEPIGATGTVGASDSTPFVGCVTGILKIFHILVVKVFVHSPDTVRVFPVIIPQRGNGIHEQSGRSVRQIRVVYDIVGVVINFAAGDHQLSCGLLPDYG